MKSICAFFTKPYPLVGDLKKGILNNFLIGLFVAAFLIFFQPFGIQTWETSNKALKLLAYGLISFLIPALIEAFIALAIKPNAFGEKWNIGKEILSILLILVFIALGNLFYSNFLGTVSLSFKSFVVAFAFTCIIGIFPVTLHVILKHNKLLRINLEQIVEINKRLSLDQGASKQENSKTSVPDLKEPKRHILSFVAENDKNVFTINSEHLLFIESADNYSSIIYTENEVLKKQLLRSSLKRMEGQINDAFIIRCHRTYIVNLKKVKKVEGNAAGYKLCFDNYKDFVPVSRNYVPIINEKLKSRY